MLKIGSPLAKNLSRFGALGAAQLEMLDAVASHSIRSLDSREMIDLAGERPSTAKVVLEGWVARYKDLPDGHRQIVALMIPGDLCNANAFILQRMDHSLGTLTRVRYAEIDRENFESLLESSRAMLKALWCNEMVTASIQREWTANIGQRRADARIAHLFCEMQARLQLVGLAPTEDSFDFPLTQTDIAEATGLTPVHVNRMLQVLRSERLIELRQRHLTILDLAALRDIAMFDPTYLHI